MSDPIDKMTRFELLNQVRIERSRLDETLAHLTPTQMLLPGIDCEWSVKDVLAHSSSAGYCPYDR